MKLFGFEITRAKAAPGSIIADGPRAWWPIVRESFAGAWQRNVEIRFDTVLTYTAVFRCIALISSDIAKMRLRLVAQDEGGFWFETENPAYSPILRKPNRFQTRIQFVANWMESKLIHGNTFVLKERDQRGVVHAIYILSPPRVTVLVAPDGSVFYQLSTDHLAGVADTITVPAREIIHDRMNTFYHPLVGLSPILAAGLPAMQGLRIQQGSTEFFANGAQPGGILTAPGHINNETAARLQKDWNEQYGPGGSKHGMVAVLGDGLKFESMAMTATDSQLLEQLKWTAETVASAFGVPAYKIGIGQQPTYANIEALNAQYYSECLQIHIEHIEELLDHGLELKKPYGAEFDLDDLLRMDQSTAVKAAAEATKAGFLAPNEARAKFGYVPVDGGESPYLQQQQYSLAALAERDRDKPFVKPASGADAAAPGETQDNGDRGNEEPDADGARGSSDVILLDRERLKRKARHVERRRAAGG